MNKLGNRSIVHHHAHLQQPLDAGVLSRLRSTPCERGAVDAPGSFFGNFFAETNAQKSGAVIYIDGSSPKQ